MKRPTQRFSPAYLERCRRMTSTQIVQFLDDFRQITLRAKRPRTPISVRIPTHTLRAFKVLARARGIPYQRKIQELMAEWVTNEPRES